MGIYFKAKVRGAVGFIPTVPPPRIGGMHEALSSFERKVLEPFEYELDGTPA